MFHWKTINPVKHFFVIGASSGIGKAIREQLEAEGHQVTTASRTDASNPLDVTAENPDFSFLPEVLDGLVYCPGTINLKPFNRLSAADFNADWNTNVLGAVKAIQAALPALKKAAAPSVVMFSTVAVAQGMPFHASVAASKGAIEALGRSLAAEFAPSIRVNVIAPSITDTPLASKLLGNEDKKTAAAGRHPLKKVGSAGELAALATFLLGENAGWITGQVFHVDGGMSALKI